ncbi:MAG: LysM peptidoglycan-binding domain-containing protein [Actinomycetia bacterium]|nr:LysM peptidoglycan-binding domain-containing protein [Actinomycetes bacterium]MCP4224802.1 LysM peptidoglycan-binding domain-containing protein [Actinomycetes bacterium]MCP5033453.1 LysM peptidoglycan-binding domain-containing protein [Actinomycetes bacterium]
MAHKRTTLWSLVLTALVASMVLVPASAASAETSYVVEPGDTLSVIAKVHGVTTSELASANGISNYNLIRIGQRLIVPVPEPVVYTVESGDTVSGIARHFGVAASDIVSLNALANPNRIWIGQKLHLPSEADEASTLALLAARYPAMPTSITDNPERLELIPSFERWAAHYGVAPDLLMALAYQESGWQASVVSNKGAIGIGQLLPSTATWVATDLVGLPDLDPYNPDDNIRMSARFLLWLTGFHGNEGLALAGYYQGPTSVAALGLFQQTQAYVASVSSARVRFQRN